MEYKGKTEEYYEKLDKRTKEYKNFKEWKKNFENAPEGAGDIVKQVLDSPIVKPVTEAIKKLIWKDNEDCGCDERQKKLNRLINFHKPNCLTEEEYNYLTEWFSKKRLVVNVKQRDKLYEVYNRIFNSDQKPTNCTSCIKSILNKLETVLKAYK